MKKVILLCLGMFTLSCLHGMDSSGAGSSTPTPGKSWYNILPEDVLRHISSLIKTDKDFMNYLKTLPKRELLPENIINHYREFFETHPNSKLLLKAIKAGKVTFAQQLASVGNFNLKKNQIGNLNLLDEENNTALTLAIKMGGTSNNDDIKGAYKELTRIIIDKKGVKLNTINKANQTAYKLARDNGWTDIVNLLKEKGANPEQGFDFDNRLIDAVRNNNYQLVQQLLGEGINPDNQDLWGDTPLIWAAYSNNPDMVEVLLAANADPNIQGYNGNTALIWAAFNNNLAMVEVLLAANADPNIQNKYHKKAIDYGWYNNDIRTILDPITKGQIWRKYTQKRYVIPAATLAYLAAYYAYKKLIEKKLVTL